LPKINNRKYTDFLFFCKQKGKNFYIQTTQCEIRVNFEPNAIPKFNHLMDKATEVKIIAACKKAVMEAEEVYKEEWLSARELCKQIPFFPYEWLRDNPEAITFKRPKRVNKETGEVTLGHRFYPKHQILREINEGLYDMIEY
jgi:hypothetical protein